jgi:methylated-DNA-[protein]-cysteine S-methyltransferase
MGPTSRSALDPAIGPPVWTTVRSELGEIALIASEAGLTHLLLPRRGSLAAAVRRTVMPLEPVRGLNPALAHFAHELRLYLTGAALEFTGPLDLRGTTAYERAVYAATRAIPYGETRSYGWIAAAAGGSPRAAGNALGRNPIAIVIPCHRVVASAGLGGFTGGLPLKRRLLALEGAWPLNQLELRLPAAAGSPGARPAPASRRLPPAAARRPELATPVPARRSPR